MKKILAILLALVLIVSVISCNKKDTLWDTVNSDVNSENSDSVAEYTDDDNSNTESIATETFLTPVDDPDVRFNLYEYNAQEYLGNVTSNAPLYYSDIAYLGIYCGFEYMSTDGTFEYPINFECSEEFYTHEYEKIDWSYSYLLGNGSSYVWRFAVKEHPANCTCDMKEKDGYVYRMREYKEGQLLPHTSKTDLSFREDVSGLTYGHSEYVCILPGPDDGELIFEVACYYNAEGHLTKISWYMERLMCQDYREYSIIFKTPVAGQNVSEGLREFLDRSTLGLALAKFNTMNPIDVLK